MYGQVARYLRHTCIQQNTSQKYTYVQVAKYLREKKKEERGNEQMINNLKKKKKEETEKRASKERKRRKEKRVKSCLARKTTFF